MEIRPIRTNAEYEAALTTVDRLWAAEPSTREAEHLDVLATLIDAYERATFSIEPPDPVTALLFRLEQLGWGRKDLEPYIGTRARVSEILTGARPLTLPMIRRLHEGLGIPAEVLIKAAKKRRQTARRSGPKRRPDRAARTRTRSA